MSPETRTSTRPPVADHCAASSSIASRLTVRSFAFTSTRMSRAAGARLSAARRTAALSRNICPIARVLQPSVRSGRRLSGGSFFE